MTVAVGFDGSYGFDSVSVGFDSGVTPSVGGFPVLSVQCGFASPPGETGNLLVLNDPSRGLLNQGLLGGGGAGFTDVTAYVETITIKRGKAHALDAANPGTCVISFLNLDGRFDPNNVAGPYVSGGASLLVPMVVIAITATWRGVTWPLFYGYADYWKPKWADSTDPVSRCEMQATDALKILRAFVPFATSQPVGAGEDTGARINRLVSTAGFPSGSTVVDTGNSTLQATTLPAQRDMLTEAQLAVDSEQGALFVTGGGALTFQNRHHLAEDSKSNTSQVTFGDQGLPQLPIESPAPQIDDQLLKNAILAQVVGGSPQTFVDSTSESLYTEKVYYRTDLVLQYDTPAAVPPTVAGGVPPGDALDWAAWLVAVNKIPENRIEEITVTPRSSDLLWPYVLGLELRNYVTVVRTPPYTGTLVSMPCFIEGIEHTIGPGREWETKYQLSSAVNFQGGPGVPGTFILNSSTLGVLNQNALGGY